MKKSLKNNPNFNKKVERILAKEIDPGFYRRAKIILKNISIKGRMRVLDVGCGRGFYENALSWLYPNATFVGIDAVEKYLSIARNSVGGNVSFYSMDARRMKFTGKSFDRFICTEVLEHIIEDERVVSEILRVLKKGGEGIFTVPYANYPFLWDPANWVLERLFNIHLPSHIWWISGIWADHVRLYFENQLVTKLISKGFKIEKVWHTTRYCFPFAHFLLYGIGKNLVEAGIFKKGIDRFDYEEKSSLLTKILKAPFFLVDRFNKDDNPGKSFLNLVVLVSKP